MINENYLKTQPWTAAPEDEGTTFSSAPWTTPLPWQIGPVYPEQPRDKVSVKPLAHPTVTLKASISQLVTCSAIYKAQNGPHAFPLPDAFFYSRVLSYNFSPSDWGTSRRSSVGIQPGNLTSPDLENLPDLPSFHSWPHFRHKQRWPLGTMSWPRVAARARLTATSSQGLGSLPTE